MAELDLSGRFFQRLSDHDLVNAIGFDRYGRNVGKANREMRRRAANAGYPDVYAWLWATTPCR